MEANRTNEDESLVFPGLIAKGLTKRELFAAMAMQGLLAHYGDGDARIGAQQAVGHADALLTALENSNGR